MPGANLGRWGASWGLSGLSVVAGIFPLALVTRSGIPNPSRTNSQLYATAVCVYDGLMAEGRGGEVGWIDGAMQCNGQ